MKQLDKIYFYPYCRNAIGFCKAKNFADRNCTKKDTHLRCKQYSVRHPLTGNPPSMIVPDYDENDEIIQ